MEVMLTSHTDTVLPSLDSTRHLKLYRQLQQRAKNKEVYDVVTTLERYSHMAFEQVRTPRTVENTNALVVTCILRQIEQPGQNRVQTGDLRHRVRTIPPFLQSLGWVDVNFSVFVTLVMLIVESNYLVSQRQQFLFDKSLIAGVVIIIMHHHEQFQGAFP